MADTTPDLMVTPATAAPATDFLTEDEVEDVCARIDLREGR